MRSLVAAWCAVALCALVVVSSVAAHSMVHPLSKVRVDRIKHATRTGSHGNSGVITINTQQFKGMMDSAVVTWSGVASVYPGDSDWIGVWSPKPADYTKTAPAKYKFVTPDEGGSGQTTFNFLNMRDSYVVAYFTGGLQNPTLLAESAPVEFDNYHMPQQIHLAYTNNPTEMVIQWTTLQNSFPSVNYGLTPAHLNNTLLRVRTSSYKATNMCGAPATTVGFHDPGQLHVALLTGLEPNTQYFYQLGDESTNSRSDVLNFWTAPVPGAQTPVDFIIFGDLGQVELDGSNEASMMDGSILTTVAMAKDFEDGTIQTNLSAAVFHIGDISYARGYATMWEQFFYQISTMSPYLPWMTTDGNHERDFPNSGSVFNGSDSGGECGVPYEQRFHMPTSAPDETWYSLNYGPVHFIVMSTEHDFSLDSKQYAWIEADLAAVDRKVTPFIILTGHRPMYLDANADGGDYSISLLMQQVYEPLMQKYQVDLGVWGHHHSAQRTCPVFQGPCVLASQGTIHLVTGASGAGFSTNILRQAPSWIEYVEDNIHGYSRVRVRGDEMTIDFVDSRTRTVIDTVTLQSRFPADEKEGMTRVAAEQVIDRLNALKDQ